MYMPLQLSRERQGGKEGRRKEGRKEGQRTEERGPRGKESQSQEKEREEREKRGWTRWKWVRLCFVVGHGCAAVEWTSVVAAIVRALGGICTWGGAWLFKSVVEVLRAR